MHIESIRLKNFKSFRDAKMSNIPNYCVVVGANGSGKSTLFDVFGFLKDCLTYDVQRALQVRVGFTEVASRGVAAPAVITIEIQFRMKIAAVHRLVTYILEIGKEQGSPIVEREILRYKRGPYGSPYHFLDFSKGRGYAITNEEDFDKPDEKLEREEQSIGKNVLAIKGLGQFERFKAASAFRILIEDWHISDFHINRARPEQESAYAEHLSREGENLSFVTEYLYNRHPETFKKILQKMSERVPGIKHISAKTTAEGRALLRFPDGAFEGPFIDRYVSDGTIKMFAYLVLLYDPDPHPLLCVEEPENQLYPKLQGELAEEFRFYANQGEGQVFVSTHSPDFLNAVELDEVFWLVKRKGYTEIKRAKEDKQIAAFMADGDKMGYLWKQGFLKGRIRSEGVGLFRAVGSGNAQWLAAEIARQKHSSSLILQGNRIWRSSWTENCATGKTRMPALSCCTIKTAPIAPSSNRN